MESNNLLTIYSIQFNLLLSSRKLHLILYLNVNSLDRLLGEKCQLCREAFQPQKIMHALGVYGLFASLLSIKKEEENNWTQLFAVIWTQHLTEKNKTTKSSKTVAYQGWVFQK